MESSAALDRDREEILARHKDWWEANNGLDIPRMEYCFPRGMNYLMFNLNGHPYFGIEEKVKLWEWYKKELELGSGPVKIMQFEIIGDVAWIASELQVPLRAVGAAGTGSETWDLGDGGDDGWTPYRARCTEVYRRDDGEGKPRWTMWHYHASPLPPEDEPRPAFGDTAAQRGLGWVPWEAPPQVVGLDS